jgi:4-alpha-glucanotransferase
VKNPLRDRRAGVLLHPTSLPGPHGCGNIGQDARRFIDFLQSAGITVWQMLPLGPTHADRSPYQCLSVHAGNTGLICLDDLVAAGWLSPALAASAGDNQPAATRSSRQISPVFPACTDRH